MIISLISNDKNKTSNVLLYARDVSLDEKIKEMISKLTSFIYLTRNFGGNKV